MLITKIGNSIWKIIAHLFFIIWRWDIGLEKIEMRGDKRGTKISLVISNLGPLGYRREWYELYRTLSLNLRSLSVSSCISSRYTYSILWCTHISSTLWLQHLGHLAFSLVQRVVSSLFCSSSNDQGPQIRSSCQFGKISKFLFQLTVNNSS